MITDISTVLTKVIVKVIDKATLAVLLASCLRMEAVIGLSSARRKNSEAAKLGGLVKSQCSQGSLAVGFVKSAGVYTEPASATQVNCDSHLVMPECRPQTSSH